MKNKIDGSIVAEFKVYYRQFLNPSGKQEVEHSLEQFDPKSLIPIYKAMRFTRAFDTKAVSLQRTGRIGTYASSLGQEAISVGVASVMRQEDVLVPSYREAGAMFWRGISPDELFLYWGGDERGSNFKIPENDYPISIPVGSHAAHAAGVAYAFKYRKEPRVAICMIGDGATSKGDFYEALNVAGVWKLPVVFIVSNNRWAISIPQKQQTAAHTLAQKAISAGIPGEQIDGNDVIAVRTRSNDAIETARNGQGPRLIEAITYRLGDHTTADDASRYRDDAEVSENWKLDPMSRLRNYLINQHIWDKAAEEALTREIHNKLETAVDHYLKFEKPNPESMFDYLFESLPQVYQDYRDELKEAKNA